MTRSLVVRLAAAVAIVAAAIALPHLAGGDRADALGSGAWSTTAPPPTARFAATSTLLGGPACQRSPAPAYCGRVLVAGGIVATNSLTATAAAEIYDPASGTWTAAAPMNAARGYHTATLLQDGRVLVVGGRDAATTTGYLTSAEVYDPAINRWATTGAVIDGLGIAYHTATLLGDGRVLIAGGERDGGRIAGTVCADGNTSSQTWSPSTGTWSNTAGCLRTPRRNHTAALLAGGQVMVMGGYAFNGQTQTNDVYNTTEIFDPGKGGWVAGPPMATARAFHMLVPLSDGRLLAAGGQNTGGVLSAAEAYDQGTRTWRALAPMNAARTQAAGTLLADGAVLVAGGVGPSISNLASSELYDPAHNSWTTTAPMASARSEFTLTTLTGGLRAIAPAGRTQGRTPSLVKGAEIFTYTLPVTPGTTPTPTVPGTPGRPGTPQVPTGNPTPVPGCTPAPHLSLNPPLMRAGRTTIVTGGGFCAGAVNLVWDHGIGNVTATADAGGNFTVTMFVLPREEPGERTLLAAGTGGATASKVFLVVPGASGPPTFIERR